ncbi:MAG: PQQ-dependent sugar dehydrogenase, partial [Flavobacterium sp.]
MKCLLFYFALLTTIAGVYSCKHTKKKSIEKDKSTVADSVGIKLQEVTTAISSPIQISIPTDSTNRTFITDHNGKIWILKNDSLLPKPFLDISVPVKDSTQPKVLGKISGVAFHPLFEKNHKFYVCYSAATSVKTNPAKLVVSEFTVCKNDPDSADIKSEHRV